ncbi:MAG: SPOR domain-containing protein, partial [Rickettsiales bacterium]|nr:SPOR domain-containing protein [Rickettsiales bacterium]
WENIKEKYPNLLDSKNYYIEQNDKSSVASLYKLQLGSFENENDANGFCNEYIKITNKSKIDCIVVK